MATTLADLAIRIGVDSSKADKGLDQTRSKAESFASKLDGVGKRAQGAGSKLTAFATVPLLGLGNAAVDAASNLSESINAVNTVFGPASKTIHEFGKTSAESVGLSTRAFNEMVTPIGAALGNVGFSADEAAQSSVDLTKRAADMASVFNTDVGTALEAIQAGLRGEADPLEKFGVGLSAAAVKAHGMELGLANANGEMSKQAEAQARISLLMAQTDKLAGDFTDTSNELANSQRVTAAQAENAAAAFGEKLAPAKAKIITLLSGLIDRFNGLSPQMQNTIIMVAGIAAAVGPLLVVLGTLTRGVAGLITIVPALIKVFGLAGKAFLILSKILLANPWVLVIAAIVLLVVAVVKNWDKIKAFIIKAWNKIKSVTSSVWNGIKAFVSKAIDFLVKIFLNFTGPGLIIKHWATIKRATSAAWNFVVSIVRALIARTVGHINNLRQIPGKVIGWFRRAGTGAKNALGNMVDFIRSIPGRILSALGNVGGLLFDAGSNIITGMLNGIRSAAGRVMDEVRNIAQRVRNFLPFSLPKEGPLRTHPVEKAGRNLMLDLSAGIAKAAPGAISAMRDVAGEIGDPFSTMPTVPGASRVQPHTPVVRFEFAGGTDSQLATVLMRMLRAGDLPTFEAA